MTYGYSHPLSSYSSVTRFQVKAHILRVRGQSVSHAANLTGDVLPQLPLVEPKSMVYYIQLCLALISLSNRLSLLAHRVTNDGLCTPLAVSHKPSYQEAISARKQSLVHRDIKLKLFIAIISPIIKHTLRFIEVRIWLLSRQDLFVNTNSSCLENSPLI